MLKKIRVLYFSFDSGFGGPLLASQIIPHLKELSKRDVRFYLISFESKSLSSTQQKQFDITREIFKISKAKWWPLKHIYAPRPFPSIIGIFRGILLGIYVTFRYKIDIFHGRSIVGGSITFLLSILLRKPWIFDPRILHAEAAVLSGDCRRNSLRYSVLWWLERKLSLKCNGVRVESWQHRDIYLQNHHNKKELIKKYHLIVNGVDLNTFKFNSNEVANLKEKLNIPKNVMVFVYLGTFGHGRPNKEMAMFVHMYQTLFKEAHFLILTYTNHDEVSVIMKNINLSYTIKYLPHQNIPQYLSLADAAITFNDPQAYAHTMPLKFAEYLACGIPVVINKGLLNMQNIIEKYNVGVVVADFSLSSLQKASHQLHNLLQEKDIRQRCRYPCHKELSIEHASEQLLTLYRYVLLRNK